MAYEERKSIEIKDKDLLDKILNVDEKDISSSFIYDLFGEYNGKAKVNPYDFIMVPPNTFGIKKKNKNSFRTTVGIWIFNKYFIEHDLFDIFGYMNENINGKTLDKMNQTLSYALMEDKITVEQLKTYLMKTQLMMPYVTILSPNHSEKVLTCTRAIEKKKKELIAQYGDEMKKGNVEIINKVEKELLDFAVAYVGNDPSMDTFLSNARGNINNNFKNMYVMKGAIRNLDPNAKQEYKCAVSNYTAGISAEEYVAYADSAAGGSYARGIKTAYGGYMENLFAAAYQDVILDKEGSDCGTKRTIKVHLTKGNVKKFMYNYIVTSSGLVELNSDNMDKYIDKTVNMRFGALCEHQKICNKCAGNMFYKLKIQNLGMVCMNVPSILKNKSMKAFHDSTITVNEIDPMKAFGLK